MPDQPLPGIFESNLIPDSLITDQQSDFFMVREKGERFLVISPSEEENESILFEGEELELDGKNYIRCPLTHHNASALRERFPHTSPVKVGKVNSFGFGDRLGNAGAAHLKAVRKTDFKPVLAQQSVRELQRTGRTAEEVLDAATWAVFETGYREGFGADGDHLKNEQDIDRMLRARYTMLTLDPGDHVEGNAAVMERDQLNTAFQELPWDQLEESPEHFLKRYSGFRKRLFEEALLQPSEKEIITAIVKYGKVIAHTKHLAFYISDAYPDQNPELELSVDETDHPTTLFEHWLIASELHRLGVALVSLAPRFSGDFEKGVDFRGDRSRFAREYGCHLEIARQFGNYKLSIHSGSDKFSVYKAIGSLNRGAVHVKTAGTSYLEALRTIARVNPGFFMELLEFSKSRFDLDRKSYHISGRVEEIPPLSETGDAGIEALLDNDSARQVLHVTYGSVLNSEEASERLYKQRLMNLLSEHNEQYEEYLLRHFERHLKPFETANA